MPIYEYKCENCGAQVERLGSYGDNSTPCICGGEMVRQISMPGVFLLKGSGFYSTDHGNQAHFLKPKDQAIRAERDCRENGIKIAKP